MTLERRMIGLFTARLGVLETWGLVSRRLDTEIWKSWSWSWLHDYSLGLGLEGPWS